MASPRVGELIRAGELELRPADGLVLARGRAVRLSVRELALLSELARRQNFILTRAELYEAVWRRPLRDDDRSVDVYVRKLRVKLEEALPEWRFIHTHFGFGYRFHPEPARPGTP